MKSLYPCIRLSRWLSDRLTHTNMETVRNVGNLCELFSAEGIFTGENYAHKWIIQEIFLSLCLS
jgi:hypothetical protein